MNGIVNLVLALQIPVVLCQDEGSSDLSKAFITLGVLFGALVISLIVAKIVDFCYDRSTLRDDASDISEHTRKLIRARLAVMTFPKRGEPVKPATKAQRVSRVIRIWSAKSKRNSQISADAELGSVDAKGDKHLKVAFIDIPDTITQANSTKKPTASTLQVPLEPDVMVLESADDLSDSPTQNMPEVVLKVPVLPSRSPTPTSALKQETKKSIETPTKGASDKPASSTGNTDPKTSQLPNTTKSVPKNETKSSTAAPTPKYVPSTMKPLNKSKSVPFIATRSNSPTKEKPPNATRTNSPTKEKPPNATRTNSPTKETPRAFRSPSPPKILVKKPTQSEFVPTVTRNTSTKINVKTVSEKDTNQTNVVTTQPKSTRTMSAKSDSSSPRVASERRRLQTPARSAPSKIVSTSNDKSGVPAKTAATSKAESKKSAPTNKSLQ